MKTSKAVVGFSSIAGIVALVVGYISAVFWLIGIVATSEKRAASEGPVGAIIVTVILFLLSIGIVLLGHRTIRRVKRFRTYVGLISSRRMTAIPELAANTGRTVEFVQNDLKKMIEKGYFSDAGINMQTNTVLVGDGPVPASHPVQGGQAELVAVTCAGCGAVSPKQKNAPSRCIYCKTPL